MPAVSGVHPSLYFGAVASVLTLLRVVLVVPMAITYWDTGLVPRLPIAVLVLGLVILDALNLFAALILDTVVQGRREIRRLGFLAYSAPGEG